MPGRGKFQLSNRGVGSLRTAPSTTKQAPVPPGDSKGLRGSVSGPGGRGQISAQKPLLALVRGGSADALGIPPLGDPTWSGAPWGEPGKGQPAPADGPHAESCSGGCQMPCATGAEPDPRPQPDAAVFGTGRVDGRGALCVRGRRVGGAVRGVRDGIGVTAGLLLTG